MRKLLIVLVAILAAFTIVSSASAATTVVRPFPQGIDASNANRAWSQVKARASVDTSYAQAIARAAGVESFSAAEFTVAGYDKVSEGTNSATVTSSGQTIGVSDTAVCRVKAKAFVIKHKVTGETVEICVGCGNVRLKKGTPIRPVKWAKGTVLPFHKKKTIKRTIECPSGQKVPLTVRITVKGKARARTWGKVWGRAKLKMKQQVKLKIKGKITAKCAKMPPAPIPVTVAPPPTQQYVCPDGKIVGSPASCVAQSNSSTQTCGNGQIMSETGCITIQTNINVVCGNVNQGGNGVNQGGNCNQVTTPPPTTTPQCPPGNTWNGTKCVKDGTTTPTPPTTAPGPNPAPSPQDPAPGGHMCYDEVTGSPVSPVNGLCPPGSFGG